MVPILYILMRSDLDSMNPGKAMAQACHAANQFVFENGANAEVIAWTEQTPQGFGTTIVLDADDEATMRRYLVTADAEGYRCGITHDPSYPVRDGKVTHLVPLDTCGFIFSPKGQLEFLRKLSLHP